MALQRPPRKNISTKSITDISVGVLYILFSLVALLAPYLNIELSFERIYVVIFSFMALIYGVFRIYRGYVSWKYSR